mmetsp:Transcript_74850/g.193188  ORF Transcript_74850/g.193188 Transcript_74850/m.193188 type:complete len:91 (-) Transcript_74850:25-297(-)
MGLAKHCPRVPTPALRAALKRLGKHVHLDPDTPFKGLWSLSEALRMDRHGFSFQPAHSIAKEKISKSRPGSKPPQSVLLPACQLAAPLPP